MRWTLSCQVRFKTQTNGKTADGEVVWFWRPRAGVKSAVMLARHAGDGDNKAWSPGRSRISRNPIAQGRPECPARTCGSCPVHYFTHGGHGCERHPAFPAPSSIEEGLLHAPLGRHAPRDRGGTPTWLFEPVKKNTKRGAFTRGTL
jgi:hypothetical protein